MLCGAAASCCFCCCCFQEDADDATGTCGAEEGGEEEAQEDDECLPGEGLESDAENDATKGAFKDFGFVLSSLVALYCSLVLCLQG